MSEIDKEIRGGEIIMLMVNMPELLTVKEVASILRLSPLTIKRWEKKGTLIPIRINSRGDRRYRKEAVISLMQNGLKI